MNRIKSTAIRLSRRLHRAIAWLALIALLLFVVSAMTHPIMVWTGPQSAKFFPPSMTTINNDSISNVINIIQSLDNREVSVGKVVPSKLGALLQITFDNNEAREYFSLSEPAKPIKNFDEQQAIWLARYYSGITSAVRETTFISTFSNEYPSVNRLLPVYKIVFETKGNLTVFVHTETNALAAMNNDWKKSLQSIFQLFHTWSWLNDYPIIRVGIIAVLLIALLTANIGGSIMLLFIKRRRAHSSNHRFKAQTFHRKLAWVAVLPLMGLIISAFYHLLQSEYGDTPIGMKLEKPISIDAITTVFKNNPVAVNLNDINQDVALNSLTLIPHNDTLLLRASLSPNQKSPLSLAPHQHHDNHTIRNKRFDGSAAENGAMIIDLATGLRSTLSDESLIIEKALNYINDLSATDIELSLITHFGPNYDFRNKRLPVWQVKVSNKNEDLFFIDPATGVLVEHIQKSQRLERLSFSILHKWNILVPLMGRENRDIIVVAFLLLLLALGTFGGRLKLKS